MSWLLPPLGRGSPGGPGGGLFGGSGGLDGGAPDGADGLGGGTPGSPADLGGGGLGGGSLGGGPKGDANGLVGGALGGRTRGGLSEITRGDSDSGMGDGIGGLGSMHNSVVDASIAIDEVATLNPGGCVDLNDVAFCGVSAVCSFLCDWAARAGTD